MKRIYKPLDNLSEDEIYKVLQEIEIDELILLPLSIGEYHPNWKFAQDLCVRLSEHNDNRVRANSILGLAYIARTKGKLEKHIVKPIILRALNENIEYKWSIIDAIEDINLFMNWNIGERALRREDV